MEGDLQRAVGRSLRRYRKKRGLTQEAFAEILGVHRTYMGGIERGERNLTLRTLERIAGILGLDALSLLNETGPSLADAPADAPAGAAADARTGFSADAPAGPAVGRRETP